MKNKLPTEGTLYCRTCGKREEIRVSGDGVNVDGQFWPNHDVYTGKLETSSFCLNKLCPDGRENNCPMVQKVGHHVFKGILYKRCVCGSVYVYE